MTPFILMLWLAACCGVAGLAEQRGRPGLLYFVAALLLTPPVALLLVWLAGRARPEVIGRVTFQGGR